MDQLFPVLIFLGLSSILSFFLIFISLVVGKFSPDPEKLSAYECGFNPFEDARATFDVQFYLIAILFIIFDVEVVLLVPLVVIWAELVPVEFFLVESFLLVLAFGFVYEWRKGVLNWVSK